MNMGIPKRFRPLIDLAQVAKSAFGAARGRPLRHFVALVALRLGPH